MTILVFNLDYFEEKLTTKFFKKSKKPYFRANFGPFCPNLSKNEKGALSGFKYSNYLPSYR